MTVEPTMITVFDVAIPRWFFILAAFLLGACIGSFLNVVIYRLPRRCLRISKGRSFCPVCKAPIRAWDNIPILSWFILRGRCRDCHARFSIRYAGVEALTAGIFALMAWSAFAAEPAGMEDGWRWMTLLAQLILAALLIAAMFIDIDLTVIPNELTFGGTVVLLVLAFVNPWHGGLPAGADTLPVVTDPVADSGFAAYQRFQAGRVEPVRARYVHVARQWPVSMWFGEESAPASTADPVDLRVSNPSQEEISSAPRTPPSRWASLVGALLGAGVAFLGFLVFGFLMSLLLAKQAAQFGGGQALGGGDVTLLMLIGAGLGWPGALLTVFGGALLGTLYAIPRLAKGNRKGIPFGPFLALAAILIATFYGPILVGLIDYFAPIMGTPPIP